MSKLRIVELQKSLRIARDAMTRIAYGHSRNPQRDCEEALDKMWKLEPKQPLQGLIGHAPRPRS